MPLASIGGQSGSFADPNVKYPRDLDPVEYDGLPPGWSPIEYAYKSGGQLGKTYVRFSSSFLKNMCTPRKCVEAQAKHNGLKDDDVAKELQEFDRVMKAKKDANQKEGLASGRIKLSGKERDKAIDTFRSKHGRLDGATVGAIPGWRSESIFRESCQQTAVTYYNKGGYPFGTVMDVEGFLGLRMQNGEDLDADMTAARSNVAKDEFGNTINLARQDVQNVRTAEESGLLRKTKSKRRRVVTLDQYSENASLRLVSLSARSKAMEQEKLEKLQLSAKEIQALLVGRGFKEPVEFLALTGYATEQPYGQVLQGLFFRMHDKSEERACFQRICREEHVAGHLVCHKTYIFWSTEHKQWRIGYLDSQHAPFAFSALDTDRPPESDWKVLP